MRLILILRIRIWQKISLKCAKRADRLWSDYGRRFENEQY